MERCSKSIKALPPRFAIRRNPGVEVLKRFGTERVEALLAFRPHLHETRFVQDPKVPRDARLVDFNAVDDVAYRQLSIAKNFHDLEAHWVGQDLDRVDMHIHAYTRWRIPVSMRNSDPSRERPASLRRTVS